MEVLPVGGGTVLFNIVPSVTAPISTVPPSTCHIPFFSWHIVRRSVVIKF